MNDGLDKLEEQLRRFQPAEVSDQLRQRVGRDLADCAETEVVPLSEHRPARSRPAAWLVVATAAAVLFVIATIAGLRLLDRRGGDMANQRDQNPAPTEPDVPPPPDTTPNQADSSPPPTMLAYRLASADSVDRLELLLDRHARVLLSPSETVDRAGLGLP